MDTLFSLVIIANNRSVYDEFVSNLEQQQDDRYELLLVENYDNHLNGACGVYNTAIQNAKGKYIAFLHPDIRFCNEHALKSIFNQIQTLHDFGVVGVAGAIWDDTIKDRRILSSIYHGKPPQRAGNTIYSPFEVETVDECFFVIKREKEGQLWFPQREGWHLYAVEMCLKAKKLGLKNYVIPSDIWHISNGKSLDSSYITQLNRLIGLYGNDYQRINTTVKSWSTRGMAARIYRGYYSVKQTIKKILISR